MEDGARALVAREGQLSLEVGLRPATEQDRDFAFLVKERAFRDHIEAVWGWDEEEQRDFHRRRFAAQDFRIVHAGGVDVGIVSTSDSSIYVYVKQIFLLPEHQGLGIGRAVMLSILERAASEGRAVELQVLKVNERAHRFFRALGFDERAETPTHRLMRYVSPQ